jgi:hypothetical protein
LIFNNIFPGNLNVKNVTELIIDEHYLTQVVSEISIMELKVKRVKSGLPICRPAEDEAPAG